MNINDIELYLKCPMGYALNKECKLDSQTYATINQKYITELINVIYFFFNMQQGNFNPSLSHLKNEWSKLWVKTRSKKDLLLPTSNPIVGWNRKREQDGLDIIIRLYNFFDRLEYDVIAVNMDYMVSWNQGDVINGSWPLIIVHKNKTRIIDFRLSDPNLSIRNDMKLTSMSMAYRKYFNEIEDDISIYLLDKGRLTQTRRTTNDYKLLKENIKQINKTINSGAYIRNLSKQCESCQFDILCKGE